MASMDVNQEQLQSFMQHPDEKPVVMINLLKFKKTAGDSDETGEAVYNDTGIQIDRSEVEHRFEFLCR